MGRALRLCAVNDIATIVGDAEWLAHRYDPGHDAFHFRRVTREGHARATFLTDAELGPVDPLVIRRLDAIAARPPSAPLHFILHSAFCCSTLLARAFDVPGVAMGLKEPVVLNDIVGWRARGEATGARIAEVVDHSLAMLARPFGKGEAVIVKPSNVANGLAPVMLALRPQARALLLHAPLPIYLRSIAKKEMDGRLWVRDLAVKLLQEGAIDLGFGPQDYLAMTDLQVAAVGWLAQHARFAALAAKHSDRVRTLDSETLLARPRDTLAALATLFGLHMTGQALDAIVAGPAFTRNSKTGSRYDPASRIADYDRAAGLHADELCKVEIWARAVADTARVAMTLPAPLIA